MLQLKRYRYGLLSLSLALPLLISVPAMARQGSDDDAESLQQATTTQTTASDDDLASDSSGSSRSGRLADRVKAADDSNEIESENEDAVEVEDGHKAEMRQRGKEILAELKKEGRAERNDSQREKACLNRKDNVDQRSQRLIKRAQNLQIRFDAVLKGATNFQQANNLTSDTITSLVSAAEAAKSQAATSRATMLVLKPGLDCTQPTAVNDVATFQAAAETARQDFKAYKSAVRALLVALQDAKLVTTTEGVQ